MLNIERSHFAQERLTMQQLLEEHKRTIFELEHKLRDKENELDEAKCQLLTAEEELEKYMAIGKRLESKENVCGRWTTAKVTLEILSRFVEKSLKYYLCLFLVTKHDCDLF